MCSFTNYKFRTRMHGAGRDENSVYSEGSGTRKVGFYSTYPGIKTKNGFAVF